MILPIIGSALEAIGTILEKNVLRKKMMDFKSYTVYEFFSIVLVMMFFVWLFWGMKPEAFQAKNLLILASVIIVSILANLAIFYSLKREKVTEFEPNWLMMSVFTIILAFAFYPSERNLLVFGLALFASICLVLSHVKKHHLVLDKYVIMAVIGSFLFACELVLSKIILPYYSPFTFYFLRCFFIFFITFLMFRPSFDNVPKRSWLWMLTIGAIWAIYRVIMYYGYGNYGVIMTSLLFILSPVFLFLFAIIFLKEKPSWREITSSAIIVVCVAMAIIFG